MLNEKIKQLRQAFNMSQVELAKQMNVTKQCISNWENDNIQPSIEMLVKLSKLFNVSCDYLLGLDDRKTIDVSSLNDIEISHIKLIINDLKNK